VGTKLPAHKDQSNIPVSGERGMKLASGRCKLQSKSRNRQREMGRGAQTGEKGPDPMPHGWIEVKKFHLYLSPGVNHYFLLASLR
jgi:hypothetical protein